MKSQEKYRVKRNGICALILFLITGYLLSNGALASGTSAYMVEFFKRPLTIESLPSQQALVHSDFKFHLLPFVNIIKPEINYRVTFTWDIYSHLPNKVVAGGAREFPSGLVRMYEGEDACSDLFTLTFKQSCTLRFYVDVNKYNYTNGSAALTKGKGPIIVYGDAPSVGSYPDPGQRFDEVVASLPAPTRLIVTPASQDGLYYDPGTDAIVGSPTRTGLYFFTVFATNGDQSSLPQALTINVANNPHDTPVFKQHYSLASATPDRDYRLDLMELMEASPGFMMTNPIHFRMASDRGGSSWLSLNTESPALLQGHPSSSDAGQTKEVTLIATSNTGGDSQPLTIQIPVAFDLDKKPIIAQNMQLTGEAGAPFYYDFRENITDLTADGNLRLILDKIEPAAPWLSFSSLNPVVLDGVVPKDAAGQVYQLTFHANTVVGGDSEAVTIPLQIIISEFNDDGMMN
ncbi:MAG TPA: hypothetical protein DDY37_01875 [Legionella sp.]|nr:hypothetical protein [Legionella sp.]